LGRKGKVEVPLHDALESSRWCQEVVCIEAARARQKDLFLPMVLCQNMEIALEDVQHMHAAAHCLVFECLGAEDRIDRDLKHVGRVGMVVEIQVADMMDGVVNMAEVEEEVFVESLLAEVDSAIVEEADLLCGDALRRGDHPSSMFKSIKGPQQQRP
jgi:hypothetical protein